MRGILIGLSVLVGLALAAVAALVFLFPLERVQAEVVRAVEQATGRKVAVDGPVRVMVYPILGVEAEGVRLSNVEGGQARDLLSVQRLAAGVELLALLQGQVRVAHLVLSEPRLALEIDAQGRPNWLLGDPENAKPLQIDALSLEDVRIERGLLQFTNLQADSSFALQDLDVSVALPDLNQPLQVDGAFTYQNERAKAQLELAKPRALLEQGATPLVLGLAAGPVNGKLDGAFDAGAGVLSGQVDVSGPSFRKLAAWLGSPLGPGPGFGAFSATGAFRFQDGVAGLDQAELQLDAMRGRGAVRLEPGEARPKLSGALAFATFDVNTYTAPPASAPSSGVNVEAGWSEAPFDFSGLTAFDADLQLQLGALLFQKLRFEDADLRLALKDGVLNAQLPRMRLYGGQGSGRLRLDASGPAPVLTHSLRAAGVQAQPFLEDAVGLTRLSGVGDVELNIRASGRSQMAMMRSLGGEARLALKDGAVKGLSVLEIARTVRAALAGGAVGPAASTDFASLAASFRIAEGKAGTSDLVLLAPFARVSGVGVVDLAAQTADMRLEPRAVASAQGQGGALDARGVGVPFRVEGPWSKLKFTPDLQGVAEAALRTQAQKLLSGAGLGGLFGRKEEADAPAPAQPEKKPEQKAKPGLLEGLRKAVGAN